MRYQRGYTLITTMMIMVVLFVIGAAGALLAYYGDMTSGAMTNFAKAYYNADYGIREVMYNANNYICNCQNNGCGFSQTLSTGGTVKVITTTDQAGKICFIESIGTGQTGGYVAKAVAIAGNTSNWAAAGIMDGISFNLFGSMAINGCDPNCKAAGLIYNNFNPKNLNLQTCSNIQNPNNPSGLIGNPPAKATGATDVTQLITLFNSFSQLSQYLQTLACPPNGSSCLNAPPQPSGSCSCIGNATIDSEGNVQCNSISQGNISSCSVYYATGSLDANSGLSLSNQTIYAQGGVNIDGALNMSNSNIITSGSANMNNTANMTNSGLYVQSGNVAFDQGSTLQGSKVYVQSGDVYFNTSKGQNITADLCGGQACTSSTESIVYAGGGALGLGVVFVNGPIQGGVIYGDGGITIQGVNGNRDVGTPTEPVFYVSNLSADASINMSGTTQFNGLILANNMGSFKGNNKINGAFYVNNIVNLGIGGNASINFNYTLLNELAQAFPGILKPIYCYSGVSSINSLNITTLY